MKHEPRRSAGQHPRQAQSYPLFDRPKLFATLSQDEDALESLQGVGLLSALNAGHQPARRADSNPASQRAQASRSPRPLKVLLSLMGAGALVLMACFVMVVQHGHEPGPTNKATALPPSTAHAPAPTPATTSTALVTTPAPVAGKQVATQSTLTEPAHTSALPGAVAKATPPARKKPKPEPADKAKTSSQDDEVAFLEAVFAHTSSKRLATDKPVSNGTSQAEDQYRHCNSLSGAAAATCRAKVCVHSPTLDVCHAD